MKTGWGKGWMFLLMTAVVCGYFTVEPGDLRSVRRLANSFGQLGQSVNEVPSALRSLPGEFRAAGSQIGKVCATFTVNLRNGIQDLQSQVL